ncbi:TetR/AcrR family transcriptional regulator C-terminal domain-containing protein [Phenylobacterium sp.]|uniref:TetR/AcrR family transcriptional regulator n=1 Tax=Phenylobacterium sp. TaxID=1871053 RepID=UPI00286A7950|nr:TetR/AcrR family transcriptional regulator C-terminal domain-containing protein [Phenylobacterium sp.]
MPRPKGTRDFDYEDKRRELLRRMTLHAMRRDVVRPSLRDLAAAADVTVPTLRHYFGARRDVLDAMLEESLRLGRGGLDAQARSDAPFDQSMRDYARALIGALAAPRDVKLGDVFAVSLGEGLLDTEVSASTLRHTLEPTIETLEARLAVHVARGEMIETDVRTAALMLLSPLLLASLHQDQLSGATCRPMALDAMADDLSAAFVRAYARQPALEPA